MINALGKFQAFLNSLILYRRIMSKTGQILFQRRKIVDFEKAKADAIACGGPAIINYDELIQVYQEKLEPLLASTATSTSQ
jgi:hypothetical protein